MNKEELLRRLEERLARGEIGEKTYLDIKARYDAMPVAPPAPEVPSPPEPPIPPEPPEFPRHAGHAGHPPFRNGDLQAMIERTIESAMEQVAASVEAGSNRDDVRRRMDEVNRRVQEAMSKFGPRIEEGGRVCVIRGSGTVGGGQHFEEFKCAGSGTVEGDLLADEAHISGVCVIEGRCVGQEFHASGRAEIGMDVEVDEFHVAGKATVGGDVRARDFNVSGSAKIGGSILDAEDVVLTGAVTVGGWVKTHDFSSRGKFEIGGGIEAEEVDIRLAGSSKVPVIKAREIEVRRHEPHGELTVDTIDGQEIYLDSTRAGLVRGHSVRVGPFCSVHTVEAEELEVHETSTVKERRTPAS
jgi:cytoskeletal protein CcmA (bactofilin family)